MLQWENKQNIGKDPKILLPAVVSCWPKQDPMQKKMKDDIEQWDDK